MSIVKPYSEIWDMSFKKGSARRAPRWLAYLAYIFGGFVLKVAFRFKTDGKEDFVRLAQHTGVVVVGNHTSYLDAAFAILAGLPRVWTRLVARDNVFENAHGFAGHFSARVGAIPIKRDSADLAGLRRATMLLKNGECIGVFPEGTRRGKGSIAPSIHGGVAFLAKMGNVPLVPLALRHVGDIKHKHERIRFPRVTMEYGNPVFFDDFMFLPKAQRLEGCAWYVMRETQALVRHCTPEEVDMPALFPQDTDYTAIFAEHPLVHHSVDEAIAKYACRDEATKENQ